MAVTIFAARNGKKEMSEARAEMEADRTHVPMCL